MQNAVSTLLDAHVDFVSDFENAVIAALPEPAKGIYERAIDRDADLTNENPLIAETQARGSRLLEKLVKDAAADQAADYGAAQEAVAEAVKDVLALVADGQASVVPLFPTN